MDRRIRFGTKKEPNARRERAFLDLSPGERFEGFLRSFNEGSGIFRASVDVKPTNSIIKERHAARRG